MLTATPSACTLIASCSLPDRVQMTRLKLKVSGADEAISLLKGMLRVCEQGGADAEEELRHAKEHAKELKEELEHAHATLERALADLEVRLGSDQTL